MSIYKEGYYAISILEKRSVRIFPDACDYGVPVNRGDLNWNISKGLVAQYAKEDSRKHSKYSTGESVSQEVELLDEGAVSDERKTYKEALDKYLITFTTCNKGECRGYVGFINIEKIV